MTAILVLAQQKGGAGKTTLAVQLAHAFAARGRVVRLADLAPQRSLTRWAALRQPPDIPCETIPEWQASTGLTRAAAKAKVLADEFRSKQTNANLAMGLALDRLYGVNDPEGGNFAAAVNAVTADELIRAAQQYLIDPVAVVITQEPVNEEALRAILDGTESPAAEPEAAAAE